MHKSDVEFRTRERKRMSSEELQPALHVSACVCMHVFMHTSAGALTLVNLKLGWEIGPCRGEFLSIPVYMSERETEREVRMLHFYSHSFLN